MRCNVKTHDFATGAEYLKMAADQGLGRARFYFGECLLNVQCSECDVIEAVRYYKMAAENGVADAQFKYGSFLQRGDGIDCNRSEAARYYKMAADQGLAEAQFNIQNQVGATAATLMPKRLSCVENSALLEWGPESVVVRIRFKADDSLNIRAIA